MVFGKTGRQEGGRLLTYQTAGPNATTWLHKQARRRRRSLRGFGPRKLLRRLRACDATTMKRVSLELVPEKDASSFVQWRTRGVSCGKMCAGLNAGLGRLELGEKMIVARCADAMRDFGIAKRRLGSEFLATPRATADHESSPQATSMLADKQ